MRFPHHALSVSVHRFLPRSSSPHDESNHTISDPTGNDPGNLTTPAQTPSTPSSITPIPCAEYARRPRSLCERTREQECSISAVAGEFLRVEVDVLNGFKYHQAAGLRIEFLVDGEVAMWAFVPEVPKEMLPVCVAMLDRTRVWCAAERSWKVGGFRVGGLRPDARIRWTGEQSVHMERMTGVIEIRISRVRSAKSKVKQFMAEPPEHSEEFSSIVPNASAVVPRDLWDQGVRQHVEVVPTTHDLRPQATEKWETQPFSGKDGQPWVFRFLLRVETPAAPSFGALMPPPTPAPLLGHVGSSARHVAPLPRIPNRNSKGYKVWGTVSWMTPWLQDLNTGRGVRSERANCGSGYLNEEVQSEVMERHEVTFQASIDTPHLMHDKLGRTFFEDGGSTSLSGFTTAEGDQARAADSFFDDPSELDIEYDEVVVRPLIGPVVVSSSSSSSVGTASSRRGRSSRVGKRPADGNAVRRATREHAAAGFWTGIAATVRGEGSPSPPAKTHSTQDVDRRSMDSKPVEGMVTRSRRRAARADGDGDTGGRERKKMNVTAGGPG